MHRLLPIALLLLPACHREPSFDERFDKAAQEVEARARAMDGDVAAAERAAALAGDGAGHVQALPSSAGAPKARASSGE